jgi:hypothetical protein
MLVLVADARVARFEPVQLRGRGMFVSELADLIRDICWLSTMRDDRPWRKGLRNHR